MAKRSIEDELLMGVRRGGSELAPSDVGRHLAYGFGRVLEIDVGKRVWRRSWGFVMENNEQRDTRKK